MSQDAGYLTVAPQRRGNPLLRFLLVLFLMMLTISLALTYLFFSRRWSAATLAPSLTVLPRQLHIYESLTLVGKGFGAGDQLTLQRDGAIALRDAHGQPLHMLANEIGAFALQMTITPDWQPGKHQLFVVDETQLLSISTTITVLAPVTTPPLLKLSDYRVDLGADLPGTTTRLAITLLNAGGGQLHWQASSDRSWLHVDPARGSFIGSEVVTLIAQRGELAAGNYSAHVTFTQQSGGGRASAQILTVTMTVLGSVTELNSLSLAPASLSYTVSSDIQAPIGQAVVLQNHSQQALDWSSSVKTNAGANWLQVTPASGHLAAGASSTLSVTVSPAALPAGDYQGTVLFHSAGFSGEEPQLTVRLHVVAPGRLTVAPSTLSFIATQGQNPPPQTLELSNNGGLAVGWSLTSRTSDNERWLGAMPTAGTLAPGARATVTVQIDTTGLAPGTYQGRLTFSAGSVEQEIRIVLTVTAPASPTITVAPTILIFDVMHSSLPEEQTVTIGADTCPHSSDLRLRSARAADQFRLGRGGLSPDSLPLLALVLYATLSPGTAATDL
ncbi:BACON domain-containing protein [Thermogemmatispora sp.]|uniref:COG1470 family protein n=1 Tax=Thermogemmatispora sp. TaxID=1968838 RepID=UPI001D6F86BB|nr:choice-of-anchor D domain-containing protein [Thermogemmatispora sp.]MBX5450276.1 choice-of-anchor D domain-containing protein [Thermogemmatispora sp.]